MTRLLFCCLLFVAGAQAIAAFPTEDEVRSTLKPGMTPEEVVTLYGTPGGASSSDPTARVITYLSPIGLRTREVEGYVGFKVTFRNGRLVDWQPINTKPSYDPDPPAREHLIPVAWYYGLLFLAVFGYGVFKAFGFANREHRRIIEAFKERTIATRSLPPDFRFIDNETTVREVIDRLGPFTRKTQRLINGPAAGFRTIDTDDGPPGIITYDYEMPYRAEVVLMPEYPFELTDRIRAVFYRPPRRDEE